MGDSAGEGELSASASVTTASPERGASREEGDARRREMDLRLSWVPTTANLPSRRRPRAADGSASTSASASSSCFCFLFWPLLSASVCSV
ncbi:uncharacterized protein DS421_7g200700 [Arachis hypogaea]|nr:uncharacterized protein DS421_7g200700 [Arachis hypogaea]